MKKYKHGLVFGKFMPVHNGHLHMIHTAEANCDELTILVCSIEREPIEGVVRYLWMKELMPNANVIHVTDEVPQYPNEHPDFWNIWTKLLQKYTKSKCDVVFTSEMYGYEVAKCLGIKHEIVDLDRVTVPVSGTLVRNSPFDYWDHIPQQVKSYYALKIVFVGNECTGKTTISKQVAEAYGATWIAEYGREYCEKIEDKSYKLVESDFMSIAWGQLKLMTEGIAKAAKMNIIDTDLNVTEAYAKMYLGHCPKLISDINEKMKTTFHILMDIDLPWEDDGTRVYIKPEQRKQHFEIMKATLIKNKCSYAIVGGQGDQRLYNAVDAIEKFMKSRRIVNAYNE